MSISGLVQHYGVLCILLWSESASVSSRDERTRIPACNRSLHAERAGDRHAAAHKIAVARFTRTLGTLITSGVPILEGLAITARTSGNAVLEQSLMKVRKAVEEGRTIVDPLKESGVFPNMVVQMIGVGEATGAMDAMLQKIADFYEDEVDAATKTC